jgi:hypothetical protein
MKFMNFTRFEQKQIFEIQFQIGFDSVDRGCADWMVTWQAAICWYRFRYGNRTEAVGFRSDGG